MLLLCLELNSNVRIRSRFLGIFTARYTAVDFIRIFNCFCIMGSRKYENKLISFYLNIHNEFMSDIKHFLSQTSIFPFSWEAFHPLFYGYHSIAPTIPECIDFQCTSIILLYAMVR